MTARPDPWQQLRLDGLVAVVTGAAGGGIGTATATLLARRGAHVVVNGRNRDRVDALVAAITAESSKVSSGVADIAVPDEAEALIEAVRGRLGHVDVLVLNAAGGGAAKAIQGLDPADWYEEMAVSLHSAFHLCRTAAASMIERGFGRILFISSSGALKGTWGRGVGYVAAKAALHGMTKQLALELGQDGITVNAVAPAQIDTPRIRKAGRRDDATMAGYAMTVPVGRVGQPEDVAEVVAFLASRSAAYITGQIVSVDGGAGLASPTTMPHGRSA